MANQTIILNDKYKFNSDNDEEILNADRFENQMQNHYDMIYAGHQYRINDLTESDFAFERIK